MRNHSFVSSSNYLKFSFYFVGASPVGTFARRPRWNASLSPTLTEGSTLLCTTLCRYDFLSSFSALFSRCFISALSPYKQACYLTSSLAALSVCSHSFSFYKQPGWSLTMFHLSLLLCLLCVTPSPLHTPSSLIQLTRTRRFPARAPG